MTSYRLPGLPRLLGPLLLSIVVLTGAPSGAEAQSRVVLVIADHRDPSSIPSSSEIYRSAYTKIADKLSRVGFAPRSPAQVPAARRMQGKIERNMGLAVEVARNARTQVSAVLGVRIFITMHRRSKGNSFYVWIDGEARDVAFGKVIATHETRSKTRHKVEKQCGRDCMLERAAELIGPTATKFAEIMAVQLNKKLRR